MSTHNPEHLPAISDLARPGGYTPQSPMRLLFSGCLFGDACGYDGTSYGTYPVTAMLRMLPNVEPVHYCPEQHSFGTPRRVCNIRSGDGFDVLDGRARVYTDDGEDWTDGMIVGATAMLEVATAHRVHAAIMLDISAACGSQVIYDGPRHAGKYRSGPGVAAAMLMRHGIRVVSQRDYRTLRVLFGVLSAEPPDMPSIDQHETAWYREYFEARRD